MNHHQKNLFLSIFIFILLGFISACTSSPENSIAKVEILVRKANLDYNNNELESAKELYLQALKYEQYQPTIYYRLGNIAYKQNKLLEAQEWYIKSLIKKPNFIKVHHNLSIVYLSLAKPHMDYFNANANRKDMDKRLMEISDMIDFPSKTQLNLP